jgi:hypothetical protein
MGDEARPNRPSNTSTTIHTPNSSL